MGERNLIHAPITREIIGAALEVHRILGKGFLESVYEEALAHELTLRQLHVQRQVQVPIHYQEKLVGRHVLDLLLEDKVIVELKAIKELADVHTSIVISYLAAARKQVALLLNFGQACLQQKRIVR